jgi:hypothetical protein
MPLWRERSAPMETRREDELSCKRKCDDDLAECEESSVVTDTCEDRWDYCLDECLSTCEMP